MKSLTSLFEYESADDSGGVEGGSAVGSNVDIERGGVARSSRDGAIGPIGRAAPIAVGVNGPRSASGACHEARAQQQGNGHKQQTNSHR